MSPFEQLLGARRVVFAHAHPDDEVIVTGALIADLVSRGRSVDVVTATRGEQGGTMPQVTQAPPGSPEYVAVREAELRCSLAALGVSDHAFLGHPPARAEGEVARRYQDSGMEWVTPTLAGPSEQAGPEAFTSASVAAAAADLEAYLRSVSADVVVSYDVSGGYGHPDHVHMHHVAAAAATAVGLPLVEVLPSTAAGPMVDVSRHAGVVRAALQCYRSQLRVEGDEIVHHGGQRQLIELTPRLQLHRGASGAG